MSGARPKRLLAALLSCTIVAGCYSSRTRSASDAGAGDSGRGDGDGTSPGDAGASRDARTPLDAGNGSDASASDGLDAAAADAAADAGDAGTDAAVPPPPPSTDPGLRVAFMGDQGLGVNAVRVLELIRDENVDLVLHLGDFDYLGDPAAWMAQIDGVLGADFPYFAVVGNHDVPAWDGPAGYQALLEARLAALSGASCAGRAGVRASCTYRGLFFVLSGVGTLDTDHEAYLDASLAASDRVFKVCAWHKNQHDMQVGAKTDEVGWAAYQVCQQHGALIVTAHEHSYSRTYSLTALGDASVGHGATGAADLVTLAPGSTSVIVSGLGGHSRRAFLLADHGDDTWWAAIHARERQVQNGVQTGSAATIEDGVLFVDFHVDGDPRLARGYFKTTSGAIADSFTIVAPAQ